MAPGSWLKRNALLLFAGCILFFIATWAFAPWLAGLQWLGNIFLAVGAVNLAYWLILVRLVPKS